MKPPENSELVPLGGGDPIPLLRAQLTLGRRESCDVSLRFPNVSGQHCELSFHEGVWYIRDLGSTNGTKVNGQQIQSTKLLRPGDEITIAKRRFTIQYTLASGLHAFQGLPLEEEDISQSLLEKAGLAHTPREKPRRPAPPPSPPPAAETEEKTEDIEKTP